MFCLEQDYLLEKIDVYLFINNTVTTIMQTWRRSKSTMAKILYLQ